MKKVLSKKARIVIASSLVILFLTVVVMSVVLIFSALTYSQRVGTIFNMTYEAPIRAYYPQTYVGDSLNTTLENLISSSSSSLVATGNKYTTDANGTTKVCLEYTYNGQKYARLVGAVYNSGSGGTSGANFWFKVELIKFDTFTLSTGETIKISKMVLGSMLFDSSSNNWAISAIKTYLNGTFLTESGIDKVAKNRTYYSTTYAPTTGTFSDNGTQVASKIWLPSVDEIQEMYGTATYVNTEIHKVATDFAKATYTKVSSFNDTNGDYSECAYYWLRSASDSSSISAFADTGGYTLQTSAINARYYGFSPAFVVDE